MLLTLFVSLLHSLHSFQNLLLFDSALANQVPEASKNLKSHPQVTQI